MRDSKKSRFRRLDVSHRVEIAVQSYPVQTAADPLPLQATFRIRPMITLNLIKKGECRGTAYTL
jgi:hypothetical protein